MNHFSEYSHASLVTLDVWENHGWDIKGRMSEQGSMLTTQINYESQFIIGSSGSMGRITTQFPSFQESHEH